MYNSPLTKLVRTVARTKERVLTQSKQRRGGVTDLYALDYVGEIRNIFYEETSSTTTPADEGNTGAVTDRIKLFTQAVKKYVPNATAEGISAMIGNFGVESQVRAQSYETDFATGYLYDKVAKDPTAEGLMGSWGAFLALYGGGGLYEQGYLAEGKHYIGIGLGQWTGPRGLELFNYAKKKGGSIFSFDIQVDFMFTQDTRKATAKNIATFKGSVDDATVQFLNNWEGNPNNKVNERITYAKKYYDLVKSTLGNSSSSSSSSTSSGTTTTTTTSELKNLQIKNEAVFRIFIPADLDRFQRWFMKVMVSALDESNTDEDIIPLSDVRMAISATNSRSGQTVNLDVTEIMRKKWPCDWIGYKNSTEEVYPNNDPNEGFDIMDLAWYMTNKERDALFSAGEKIFTIKGVGNARVTLRNFLKFSHIN